MQPRQPKRPTSERLRDLWPDIPRARFAASRFAVGWLLVDADQPLGGIGAARVHEVPDRWSTVVENLEIPFEFATVPASGAGSVFLVRMDSRAFRFASIRMWL